MLERGTSVKRRAADGLVLLEVADVHDVQPSKDAVIYSAGLLAPSGHPRRMRLPEEATLVHEHEP